MAELSVTQWNNEDQTIEDVGACINLVGMPPMGAPSQPLPSFRRRPESRGIRVVGQRSYRKHRLNCYSFVDVDRAIRGGRGGLTSLSGRWATGQGIRNRWSRWRGPVHPADYDLVLDRPYQDADDHKDG